jgi:hypothetical protein
VAAALLEQSQQMAARETIAFYQPLHLLVAVVDENLVHHQQVTKMVVLVLVV